MKTVPSRREAAVARLTEDVCHLASEDLGGRVPGTEGHSLAATYIERRLREIGLEPLFADGYRQAVPTAGAPAGRNLCGVLPGTTDRRLLIGAHYDTLPASGPGADDNAAAVAITLELARSLSPWRGEASIVFAFFDQEEPPYFGGPEMGSVAFTESPPFDLGELECALVLDLCGHDLPTEHCPNGLFVMGAENQGLLVEAVEAADRNETPFIAVPHVLAEDLSDHLAFRRKDIPFLFFSCGRWQHYHSPTDTLDVLNIPKMAGIAEALEGVILRLDRLAAGALHMDGPSASFVALAASGYERLSGEGAPNEPDELLALSAEWADAAGLR